MQRAINIDNTGKTVERVLSIADPAIIESNPTGIEYILIEDYVEPPEVLNPSLDINYPMYNKETQKFYWVTINYQNTATDMYVALETANADISKTKDKISAINNQINPVPVTLEEKQDYKQNENNKALAKFLDQNPLLFTDGEYYGVTQEDQNELS